MLLALTISARAADPIAEARRLYNLGQYDAALKLATEALAVQGRADEARVVLGVSIWSAFASRRILTILPKRAPR